MPAGLDNLKHIVVLMMENRSFDHMLGALKKQDPRINGLTGSESNLDTSNEPARVQPLAKFQGQLDPDPDHHFPAVHKQLYSGAGGPPGQPSIGGVRPELSRSAAGRKPFKTNYVLLPAR
jgi:phospholipase C